MEELKAYITSTRRDSAVMLAAGAVFAAAGVVSIFTGATAMKIIGVLLIICGLVLLYSGIFNRMNQARKIRELELTGKLEELAADFRISHPISDGSARLGDEYIFRAKLVDFIRYSEIEDIKAVDRTGTDDTSQEILISVNTKNGGWKNLCNFYGTDAWNERARVMAEIGNRMNRK